MYVESCMIMVVVDHLSRAVVVLDRLPGLYGLKYDSATACGLPLYLWSYKLDGSTTRELGVPKVRSSDMRQEFRGLTTILDSVTIGAVQVISDVSGMPTASFSKGL